MHPNRDLQRLCRDYRGKSISTATCGKSLPTRVFAFFSQRTLKNEAKCGRISIKFQFRCFFSSASTLNSGWMMLSVAQFVLHHALISTLWCRVVLRLLFYLVDEVKKLNNNKIKTLLSITAEHMIGRTLTWALFVQEISRKT